MQCIIVIIVCIVIAIIVVIVIFVIAATVVGGADIADAAVVAGAGAAAPAATVLPVIAVVAGGSDVYWCLCNRNTLWSVSIELDTAQIQNPKIYCCRRASSISGEANFTPDSIC